MIIRIVRMNFIPEHLPAFLAHFEKNQAQIRSQKGCTHLQVIQDLTAPHLVCTYSIWESEEDLNIYRQSAFFGEVWAFTKTLFQAPASAQSFKQLY